DRRLTRMRPMSTLKLVSGPNRLARRIELLTRGGAFALLITLAAGGLRAAPAHAERKEAPLNLALSPPPSAPRAVVVAETTRRAGGDDEAPTAAHAAAKAPWWPWVLIA